MVQGMRDVMNDIVKDLDRCQHDASHFWQDANRYYCDLEELKFKKDSNMMVSQDLMENLRFHNMKTLGYRNLDILQILVLMYLVMVYPMAVPSLTIRHIHMRVLLAPDMPTTIMGDLIPHLLLSSKYHHNPPSIRHNPTYSFLHKHLRLCRR